MAQGAQAQTCAPKSSWAAAPATSTSVPAPKYLGLRTVTSRSRFYFEQQTSFHRCRVYSPRTKLFGSTPTTPLLSVRGCEWGPTPLSSLTSTLHVTMWRGCKFKNRPISSSFVIGLNISSVNVPVSSMVQSMASGFGRVDMSIK